MLLQLFNLSVDAPDANAFYNYPEDLSLNDTESLIEWIAEGFFDHDIPEGDDEDVEKNTATIDLYFTERTGYLLHPSHVAPEHFITYFSLVPTRHDQPHAPPPKAV
ncbi:hypothetical protein SAMN05444008_101251 [Cnuella takakiae]|uniref:Uncharacterized protein n=1 Tax=Cnuella takakiae TaxID=1302690 RepID=A0A1M4SVT8_9BACT|nr:hypothetical protein [Cnuella takakiae]OLY90609.1 hypothetical protein BUE76_00825 [Cnuella takakiae]SHE36334.1 hypothetical protein SAMN05444008_101251 [Cnuella takakiae]